MSEQPVESAAIPTAYENGWRGFESAGSVARVPGGYEYYCDGMPSMMGCGETVVVTRKWAKVGLKKSGWLVCYGVDDEGRDEPDVVLAFGPSCAQVVRSQDRVGTPGQRASEARR